MTMMRVGWIQNVIVVLLFVSLITAHVCFFSLFFFLLFHYFEIHHHILLQCVDDIVANTWWK